MADYLNVFVTEKFASNGEDQTRYTKVGAAFPHEKGDGYSIRLIPGIAVSDDLVMFPPQDDKEGESKDANGNS